MAKNGNHWGVPLSDANERQAAREYFWFALALLVLLLGSSAQVALRHHSAVQLSTPLETPTRLEADELQADNRK